MLKQKYVSVSKKTVLDYKCACYKELNKVISSRSYYQEKAHVYQKKVESWDESIECISFKIEQVLRDIKIINDEINILNDSLYSCSYNYESLSKKRMKSFNDFKNDKISLEKHKVINREIDLRLDSYKNEYDKLVDKYNALKGKKQSLMRLCDLYKKDKEDIIFARKKDNKCLKIANNNIQICNDNIDIINYTLENIDQVYFSDEDKVLERKIQPKVKKLRKIKE